MSGIYRFYPDVSLVNIRFFILTEVSIGYLGHGQTAAAAFDKVSDG